MRERLARDVRIPDDANVMTATGCADAPETRTSPLATPSERSTTNPNDDSPETTTMGAADATVGDATASVADGDAAAPAPEGEKSADARDAGTDVGDRADSPDGMTASASDKTPTDAASHEPGAEKKKRRGPVRRMREGWARYRATRFYRIWDRRPRWSYGAYVVVMFTLIEIANMMLLWSVDDKQQYDPDAGKNLLQQIVDGTYHSLAGTPAILNFFALGMLYLICVTVLNRFWVGTAVFGAVAGVFAFAGKVKVAMRGEPIIPSDLAFLSGGGGENVASFVTDDLQPTIEGGTRIVVWFVVICFVMQFLDRRRALIHCSWRRPFASVRNVFGTICRILAPVLSVWLMVSYATGLSDADSSTREFVEDIGYGPCLWNVMDDARQAGAATTFLSLTDVKAMEDEPDYSEETMRSIAGRYKKAADDINRERSATLTDSTVIMVLSETFSDPNRVPNVHFDVDPMPNIRALGQTTTSGLMLSPGYGGGTANIEFQQMTGLSMANFSSTMLSPYQQLVPMRPELFSFNQMWNRACGSDGCSVGFHPYLQRLYLRNVNYKKFGFSHLYTLDSDPKIPHAGTYQGALAESGYVTDEESYRNVLDEVRANTEAGKPAQYIELVTMQNHAPYPDLYGDQNEFHAANRTANTPGGEMGVIAQYAKGVQRTDEATARFLSELDRIDRPITVVFYGDHLPGIYNTAAADAKNALALHETNYFIWSNAASSSHDVKLPAADADYTSSNFFMTQAARQMDAKVSPYLALLEQVHAAVPAMSKSVTEGGTWSNEGAPTYLDDKGEPIDPETLPASAKQLLADYKMVQYDMTVGKNHLMDMGFMDLPR